MKVGAYLAIYSYVKFAKQKPKKGFVMEEYDLDISRSKEVVISDEKTVNKSIQKRFKGNINRKNHLVQSIVDDINEMIVGQEDAKKAISTVLTNSLMYDPNTTTPLGVLFLPGPTGVGKTELARALFKIFYGDPHINMGSAKIDANSFTEKHEVAQLKGAPPGYKGYGDKPLLHPDFVFEHTRKAMARNTLHPLFKKIIDESYAFLGEKIKDDELVLPSIILIDEFEKAHPDFITFFMNIFDEGTATLKDGTPVNFRNTIFIMTSNVGADDIRQKMEGKGSMGFMKEKMNEQNLFSLSYYKGLIEQSGLLKKEVLGRLAIIPFRPLTKEEYFQRLSIQVAKYNKTFALNLGVRLELTKRASTYLVKSSMATNEGVRSLIKMFKQDVFMLYVRLYNNGEIDEIEEKTGFSVKRIEIDYVDREFQGNYLIDENHKAFKKERKAEFLLKRRKSMLDQQEAIISLKENSFLITLRDTLLPNLKYYKALLKNRDNLVVDFSQELEDTKNILEIFGLQTKDFELLKNESLENRYYEYNDMFEELSLEVSGISLWNNQNKNNSFSGMLRYIEKYIRKYFDENKDLKMMIKGGAGTLADGITPIVTYTETLLSREITYEEEGILIAIFHREYLKLSSTISVDRQIPHKKQKEEEQKEDKEKSKKSKNKDTQNNITININFNDNMVDISPIDRLKNLFQSDFEYDMLAIKQNIASRDESSDIIDIMISIKIELEKQFDLTSNQVDTINDIVKYILKKEDFEKGKK